MLLTTFSEPPTRPPENPGKKSLLYCSAAEKCALEMFPTRACPSRSRVPPEGEGVTVRRTSPVPSFVGARRGTLPGPEPRRGSEPAHPSGSPVGTVTSPPGGWESFA